ncbi:MAG: TonB-dependent receptor [Paludibacteraceae bacterium]|nr:TonB-dependent receptor [Paludibacteraceae bacterium]
MKKKFILILYAFAYVVSAHAQTSEDTLLIQGRDIPEVSVIAKVEQPTATHKKISGEQLNRENTGQNLPYLLQMTPSFLVTSDDGLGVGYTYFRVRGTDHTRINMTVNEVPLNDAESQTVFWVNMTDMASSMSSINIQRGVGTSTNGSASFGASLNMSTLPTQQMLNDTAQAHVTLQFNGGMYNTFREMVSAQVQMPRNWRVEARLSKVNSDGFLYRAASDLFSYYGSVGYYGKKTNLSFSAFGGSEKTYMAWDGVTAENLLTDRRYNPAGEYTDADGKKAYYPNQNDNYKQQHFQVNLAQRLALKWTLNATLHYTHGGGYYEQMKANKKYSSFGLENYKPNDSTTVKRSNFIRFKHLDNHYYGGLFSINYRSEPADLTIGGAGSHYMGQHWGLVTDDLYGTITAHEFYRSRGTKAEGNIYAKANWRIINQAQRRLTLYGDLQYRYVYYHINGINDEDLQPLTATRHYHFFNPKAGLTYEDHGHQAYFNFAIANREPNRKNFTEAGEHDIPLPEKLYDYELGYTYSGTRWHAGVNLYYMDYKNQLVLTGKYSDTGAYLTRNVDKSYRMGIELMGLWMPTSWFQWSANLTLSRNKIPNYSDWVSIYDANWEELRQDEIQFGEVTIAFSPSVTFNNTFTFEYEGFRADVQTIVVSKQYLDNTMSEEAILKPYTVTNLTMHYTLPIHKIHTNNKKYIPSIRLLAQANNLFNSAYESNGGNWMCQFEDGSRYYSPWYYAQAGINVHAGFVVQW